MQAEKAIDYPSYLIDPNISAVLSSYTEKIIEKQSKLYRFFVRKATFAASSLKQANITSNISNVNNTNPLFNWTKRERKIRIP